MGILTGCFNREFAMGIFCVFQMGILTGILIVV